MNYMNTKVRAVFTNCLGWRDLSPDDPEYSEVLIEANDVHPPREQEYPGCLRTVQRLEEELQSMRLDRDFYYDRMRSMEEERRDQQQKEVKNIASEAPEEEFYDYYPGLRKPNHNFSKEEWELWNLEFQNYTAKQCNRPSAPYVDENWEDPKPQPREWNC